MKIIKFALLASLLLGGSYPQNGLSKTLTLINSMGESTSLDVSETEQFSAVLDRIQSFYDENLALEASQTSTNEGSSIGNPNFDFEMSAAGITLRAKQTVRRDYETAVTEPEKKDLTYIVTSLANDSLISLGTSKSSLKKAGDRIDHIHPFRFLMTVFTDEKLKAGAHAIRDRGGWVWEGFIDGLTGSLKEEAARLNLLQFAPDFAQKVKIDLALILPSLEQGKMTEFVNVLIDKIPREINPNRYDM